MSLEPSKTLIVNIDGGSRGNPGPSAYAFVVSQNNSIIYQQAEYLGTNTNNVAEYQGLINSLRYLNQVTDFKIEIQMDSLLVVQQVNGKYKIKQPHLIQLNNQVQELLTKIKTTNLVNISHVYRDQNQLPDQLLNECLDRHGKQ